MQLYGVDFTSRPNLRKPITVAHATLSRAEVCVTKVEPLASLEAFSLFLERPGPWIGAFDLPFGLPREFVAAQGWASRWVNVVEELDRLSRDDLRLRCKAFCDARPSGKKFAHRRTDSFAKSSPSMKWVNPPVVFMLHAAVPRLFRANVSLPTLFEGDPSRVALEGYPALLAREFTQRPYKTDDKARQTSAHRVERKKIVDALERGETRLGLRLVLTRTLREAALADPSGDALDSVLCAIQSAWGYKRRNRNFGLPLNVDPLEGWIVTAEGATIEDQRARRSIST
jgi:hypothetical protein